MRSEDGAALRQEGHVSVEDKGTRLNMTLLTEDAPALASLSINMALLTEGGGERVPFYKHGPPVGGTFFQTLVCTLRYLYVIGTVTGALSCILPHPILSVTSFKLPF